MLRPTFIRFLSLLFPAGTALSVALATQPAAADPNQYLCIVDEAAGLHYDRSFKEWRPETFKPSSKYIFRHLTPDDRDEQKSKWSAILNSRPKAKWGLFDFGEKEAVPQATCEDGEYSLECTGMVAEFKFDDKSLRFEIVRSGSYVGQAVNERLRRNRPDWKFVGDPDKPDDLVFEIGKCNAL